MSILDINEQKMLKLISRGRGGCFRLRRNVAMLKVLVLKGYATIEERDEDTIGRITPAGKSALSSKERA